MSIVTDAPSWLFLVCIAAGLVYAGALYFRDRFNRTYGSKLALLLGVFRFIVVFVLAILLLKPLLKSVDREVQKPIVVIAQDNSKSLVVGKDSSYYLGAYQEQLGQLKLELEKNYEVRTYRFGDHVDNGMDSLDFGDQLTDFSLMLDEINTRYSGRNLGAVIIASDGLYNKGSNPVYAYKKLNVPVYTIALGDTTVHRDVLISEVAANRLAYLGNKFPVQIISEARKAAGENATVTVSRNGQVLFSEPLTIAGDHFFKTSNVVLDATTVGLQKYSVDISRVENEITVLNNHADFFIDVLDSRQKVLVLAAVPHPDIAALRDAIQSNEGYSVDVSLISDFPGDVSKYDLIVFHQLPSYGNIGLSQVRNAIERKIPTLFIWGSSTDYRVFNELNLGYSLSEYRNNTTDAGGVVAGGFSQFSLSEQLPSIVRMMPPLSVPFGEFNFSPGVSMLIQQQVGTINTQQPLISFNSVDGMKAGLISGEGIWRWRLHAYLESGSHDLFNELVTKSVQYLASKEDRSLFRVNGKNDFPENEHVIFDGELYNASYEPVVDREISMKLKNEKGEEFSYQFSPTGVGYRLDAGSLPVGNYSYTATAISDGKQLRETGEFSVSPLQFELVKTIADHRLLNQFASENQGAMVYPDAMQSLAGLISSKKEIVPVVYESRTLTDLINYKWLLLLIVLLLGGEWLLRKRAGTY